MKTQIRITSEKTSQSMRQDKKNAAKLPTRIIMDCMLKNYGKDEKPRI